MTKWTRYRGTDYEVSNMGNIRNIKKGNILKPYQNTSGYLQVGIYENGIRKKVFVQRLVAECFCTFPQRLQEYKGRIEVDHINGNPQDNRAVNLRYCTTRENMNYRTNELKSKSKARRNMHIAQINIITNAIIKTWDARVLRKEKRFNYSYIRRACNIGSGKYKGFKWCYHDTAKELNLF